MRKILLALLVAATVLGGCAVNDELVKKSMDSNRADVFVEVANEGAIPSGFADLEVALSVKTHADGAFKKRDFHGTPYYKLLLNVDGQAVLVQGTLRKEITEANNPRDSEAGDGIRYVFNKKIRLAAGSHNVIVALPADDVAAERRLLLADGKLNKLVAVPVYSTSQEKSRITSNTASSFKQGVRSIMLIYNNSNI